MHYEVTIDDPKTYTRPFKVAFPLTQEPGYQNFEYACHEGNYAMFDSLSGARAVEKARGRGRHRKSRFIQEQDMKNTFAVILAAGGAAISRGAGMGPSCVRRGV